MSPDVSRTWRNNIESYGEKVTLLSSFSHLFLFIPFKEKVSGQVRTN